MKEATGEDLIATAGTAALLLARTMDTAELTAFCELLGLLKHNLDIVRFRRFIQEKKEILSEKK